MKQLRQQKKVSKTFGVVLLLWGAVLLPVVRAFEVPEAPPLEYYQNLWQQSPFDRKVLPDTPQVEERVDYVLQSTWRIGNVRYISVHNKLNKTNLIIASDPEKSDQGGKLISFNEGKFIDDMSAKIEVNGRAVDVKYDSQLIASTAPKVMPPTAPAARQNRPVTRRVVIPSGNNNKKPTVNRSSSRGIVLPGR